ncbi:unnamed protein product, partial [Staurois parvus]
TYLFNIVLLIICIYSIYTHYIANIIRTPLQIIGLRCSNHLHGMQTASTNIYERMGGSQELSEFKRSTMMSCHLCNKPIREISLLLNIPQSTVSSIITMWRQLRTTATQPQSGCHVK